MHLSASDSHPDAAAVAGRGVPSIVHEDERTGERRTGFVDSISIGREDGDIRIPADPYLSQRHVRIERSGNRFIVRDCNSTNGTFVQIRQPMELRPGDEILIGGQLFRVVL